MAFGIQNLDRLPILRLLVQLHQSRGSLIHKIANHVEQSVPRSSELILVISFGVVVVAIVHIPRGHFRVLHILVMGVVVEIETRGVRPFSVISLAGAFVLRTGFLLSIVAPKHEI